MGEVMVLMEGPAGAEALEVVWREDAAIEPTASAFIEARWAEYLAQAAKEGKSLFNGPITWAQEIHQEPADEGRAARVVLTLGAADYKTFVVTVLRNRAWFARHAPGAMRPALGNSVLLTRGDRALLGIRSAKTSAYDGRAHLIGGVVDRLGTPEMPANGAGILAHLRREMHEEAGIVERELSGPPVLLAVAQDEFLGQPELVWRWELAVDVETVGARLDEREHNGWVLLEKEKVPPKVHERMTPLARIARERWRGG